MRVTFLGTGTSSGLPVIGCGCPVCTSSDPRNTRWRASALLSWEGHNVVIDTPPEFRLQMLRAGVRTLDAVLMTHEHADHMYGMDDTRLFTERTESDMPVYARRRVADAVRAAFPYVFAPLRVPGTTKPSLDIREIDGPFEVLGKRIIPLTVMHGPLPVTAYRLGPFAYVTDCSRLPDDALKALRGVEVLVLGALRPHPHPTHFSLDEAVEAARAIGARRTFFTHMAHQLDHEATNAALPSGMALAFDGLELHL
jgi:phosphoribosyl 1,2-cyclic phosphate phosphodiesterase